MATTKTTSASSPRPSAPEPLQIKRVPWSLMRASFIREWGRPRGEVMPEHAEFLGPTGSGKGFLLRDILWERVRLRHSSVIFIVTKRQDKTALSMRWPIVDDWRGVEQNEVCIFWPQTSLLGKKRREYQNAKILELLYRLWGPDANVIIVFDEFMYVEGLSPEMKDLLGMYLREGRSHGICCVMGKQRAQGVQRDMHSETDWKFAFQMNDELDNERLAELFGPRRLWLPVVLGLDREKFEFLVQHKLNKATFISWVDKPAKGPPRDTGYRA
jgi:hypothetical protein